MPRSRRFRPSPRRRRPPRQRYAKQVGTGLGFSVTEINPGTILGRPGVGNGGTVSGANSFRVSPYRWLFEGRYENFSFNSISLTGVNSRAQRPPVLGKYGEAHLDGVNMSTGTPQYTMIRPRPGVTANQSPLNFYVNSTGDDNHPAAATGYASPPPMSSIMDVNQNPNYGTPVGNAVANSMPFTVSTTTGTVTAPLTTSWNQHFFEGTNGSPIDPYGRLIPGLNFAASRCMAIRRIRM